MPTVDIILPAFNAAHFLPMALDSVAAQTFADWRILLVDDGSTDATAAIAASYAERLGPRLRYIHQENHGLPAARNTAIRHADAEFLAAAASGGLVEVLCRPARDRIELRPH